MTNSDLLLSDASQVPPDPPLGPASPLSGAQGVRSTGAHNIHLNDPEPGSARLINTVTATWFSAGLRIYDIRDPFRREEIAAFLPGSPAGQTGCRISDVFVDDRNSIYAADRAWGGLYILEYTGDRPLD